MDMSSRPTRESEGIMPEKWRVTYHYPKRVGNVSWFGVAAKTRLEAINDVATDPDLPRILRERGRPKKVTARRED